MTDVKLVEFPGGNLNDIPQCMEIIAQALREGYYGNVVRGAAVLMTEDGKIEVFSWGRADWLQTVGLFELGKKALTGPGYSEW
jgi:hypothetical protein